MVPAGQLWSGAPARFVRDLTEAEKAQMGAVALGKLCINVEVCVLDEHVYDFCTLHVHSVTFWAIFLNLKSSSFLLFLLSPTENVALAMEHAAEGAKSWQMIEQEEYDFNQLIGRASYYSRRQTDAVRPCFFCVGVFFCVCM